MAYGRHRVSKVLRRLSHSEAMTFTDHELELLVDSITWELDFLESSGWHESPRHQTLTELQARIQTFLDHQ